MINPRRDCLPPVHEQLQMTKKEKSRLAAGPPRQTLLNVSCELAPLAGVLLVAGILLLLAGLLLPATLLLARLLTGILVRLAGLLTRVLVLLARILILIAHLEFSVCFICSKG
jgi:hypothetical protein